MPNRRDVLRMVSPSSLLSPQLALPVVKPALGLTAQLIVRPVMN